MRTEVQVEIAPFSLRHFLELLGDCCNCDPVTSVGLVLGCMQSTASNGSLTRVHSTLDLLDSASKAENVEANPGSALGPVGLPEVMHKNTVTLGQRFLIHFEFCSGVPTADTIGQFSS